MGRQASDLVKHTLLGAVQVAGVIKYLGKSSGQADALIELTEGKQSSIAGELARRRLDHQQRAEEG
jgi:hypothetical protein